MNMNSHKLKNIIQEAYFTDLATQVRELNEFIKINGTAGNFRHSGDSYKGKIRPVYFTGNPQLLDSTNFIIVASLNPKFSESDLHKKEYHIQNKSFEDYYSYYSTYFHPSNNLYYKRFFDPLGLLISTIKGKLIDDSYTKQECLLDTCFSIDLIPFYSEMWSIGKINLRDLYELNCMSYVKQIRHLLFKECKPSMILANGNDTVRACEIFIPNCKVRYVQFESGKSIKVKQGLINGIPFFGFPFLRKPNSANSYQEIIELGKILKKYK
jgi:hypothetical protein